MINLILLGLAMFAYGWGGFKVYRWLHEAEAPGCVGVGFFAMWIATAVVLGSLLERTL